MKRAILNVALALMLAACVMASLEDPLAGPTPTPAHWSSATASLDDLACVLAITDEADDVAPYIVLVNEFAVCMGSELEEETEEAYDGLSRAELVAMTIWAAGIFGAFSAFDSEGGGNDTSYAYMEGALEACLNSEEE